jgi:hypothetical protein
MHLLVGGIPGPPRRHSQGPSQAPTALAEKRDYSKDYRSDIAEQFQARLERETTISLRDHPERWRSQRVIDTRHYVTPNFGDQRRQGSS